MALYYDDLALAGTEYRPPPFGQHATPGWADDLIRIRPLVSITLSCARGAVSPLGKNCQIGATMPAQVGAVTVLGKRAIVALTITSAAGALSALGKTASINTAPFIGATPGHVSILGARAVVEITVRAARGAATPVGRVAVIGGSPVLTLKPPAERVWAINAQHRFWSRRP